jgi:hypothetical protein
MNTDIDGAERKKAIQVLVFDDKPALADIAQLFMQRNIFARILPVLLMRRCISLASYHTMPLYPITRCPENCITL